MPQMLQHLISGRGFDRYRSGLEARFATHGLNYSFYYSKGTPNPTLLVRLGNHERLGELCVWESGHCDLTVGSIHGSEQKYWHLVLDSEERFHEQLAAMFIFITKGEWTERE